jgi:hypothetical protein
MLRSKRMTWIALGRLVLCITCVILALLQIYSFLPWKITIRSMPLVLTEEEHVLVLDNYVTASYFQLDENVQKTNIYLKSFSRDGLEEVTVPLRLADIEIGNTIFGAFGIPSTSMRLMLANSDEVADFFEANQLNQSFEHLPRLCILFFDSGSFYSIDMLNRSLLSITDIIISWHGVTREDLQRLLKTLEVCK